MEVVKGFKVTDADMKCRGYQFEINKTYTETGRISACNNGFHFCVDLKDCFGYYDFNPYNRVFEVEGTGKIDVDGNKHCVEHITFIKEISWLEVLNIVNLGKGNTGIGNAGNRNAGNDNAGNDNAGYSNAGNRNAGNDNAGNYNAGNRNAGNDNAGNDNAGNDNAGNYNAGNRNAGNDNAGNYNAGNDNAGNYNAGNRNAGNYNAGNRNAGNRNAGNDNAGNYNAGNRNAGNYNAGNRNAGYSNAGNDNAGAFNNLQANYIMFNKPSEWSFEDFKNSAAFRLLHSIDTTLWIPDYSMSNEEKKLYPYYVTTKGYVKNLPYKEAFVNAWNNWSKESHNAFTSLPNFEADVFFDITGVKIN